MATLSLQCWKEFLPCWRRWLSRCSHWTKQCWGSSLGANMLVNLASCNTYCSSPEGHSKFVFCKVLKQEGERKCKHRHELMTMWGQLLRKFSCSPSKLCARCCHLLPLGTITAHEPCAATGGGTRFPMTLQRKHAIGGGMCGQSWSQQVFVSSNKQESQSQNCWLKIPPLAYGKRFALYMANQWLSTECYRLRREEQKTDQ